MNAATAAASLALAAALVSGCSISAGTSDAPQEPASANSGIPEQTEATSNGGADSGASPVAQRYASFDWGSAKTTPGRAVGIPSPPGWYEAAFGPRTTDKVIYLTYDDGPHPATTDRILNLLAKSNAKATFFVNGRHVDQHPTYLKKVTAQGHALGNHTQDHENLAAKNKRIIRQQLTDVVDSVGPTLGDCMRPPGGMINQRAGRTITEMGIVPIMWTGHAQDWAPPPVSRMVQMLKEATEPGAVILLHDSANMEPTVATSAIMIPWWTKQGYRLETIPACRK